MAREQKTKQKKTVKKRFFSVESRLTSTKIELYAASAEELDGRVVKLDLTKPLRGKAFELRLRISHDSGKLTTKPLSLQLFQPYVRKVVRKGTDYAEDSFETDSKDFSMRVKPLLVTRKRVSRNILKALRENARKALSAYIKIRTAQEVFEDITTNKLQKVLSQKLKKIYPLALCEIRAIQVIAPAKAKKEKEHAEKSTVKKQAKEEESTQIEEAETTEPEAESETESAEQ
ncbi:hypothetical protein CO038_02455 [Candidatus Pacearchaeota archaeon CG_4_9_14_0_2_um_filter_39_13]|nr:hypothetical protein [Candidatus Pacearchaeota archaeon]OIO43950.1 MAG: hypothetical protein AUJ64_01510 [Candidatus Pacearchaeota archaeon CG1_02_39_14]PJC44802.1 MAG: hypothetical protein CO038_02455 [Candidatus Pacearchaeota archaeon CG_4_9_14_0_2_um_filter_39_13]